MKRSRHDETIELIPKVWREKIIKIYQEKISREFRLMQLRTCLERFLEHDWARSPLG